MNYNNYNNFCQKKSAPKNVKKITEISVNSITLKL